MADKRGIKAGGAFVELFADDSLLVRGLDTAKRRLQAWGKSLEAIGRPMLALGLGIAAPFAAAARIFETTGSEMLALSRRTGASVEELSALSFAAEQANVSSESLEHGIRHLQKSLFEAATGSAEAQMAFTELGQSAADLSRMTAGGQLAALASGLSKFANPAEKAGLAMKLLGRGGTEMLPLLNMGAAGIGQLTARASELGLVLSGETAVAADELRKASLALWGQLKMVAVVVGEAITPALQEVVKWVSPIIKSFTAWVRENRSLATTIALVGGGLIVAGGALAGLGVVVTAVGTGLGVLATALGLVGSVLATIVSPVGLVVAALGGLGYALVTRTEAGQQALGYLGQKFSELKDTALTSWDGISAALQSGDLAAAANIAFLGVKVAWLELTADLVQPYADAKAFILSGLEEISAFALAKFTTVKIYWSEMTAFFSEEWNRLVNYLSGVWEKWGGFVIGVGKGFIAPYVAAWTFVKSEFLRLVDLMSTAWEKWHDKIIVGLKAVLTALAFVTPGAGAARAALDALGKSDTAANLGAHLDAAAGRDAGEGQDQRDAIEQAKNDRLAGIEEDRANAGAAHQQALADAKKALADAVNAAKNRPLVPKGTGAPGAGVGAPMLASLKGSTAGTFAGFAAERMGYGGSAVERTARAAEATQKATEATQKQCEEMVKFWVGGGMSFG
jgi:hypothetical protein